MCVASPIPSSSGLYRRSISCPCKRQSNHSLQSSAPPHKKALHRHRVVSFSTSACLHIVTNLTFHYKQDLWYTPESIQKTKRKNALLVYLLKSKRLNKDDFESTLLMGLEKHLQDHEDVDVKTSISFARQELLEAVLHEQRKQAFFGIQDVEALAMISRMKTQRARDRARIIGLLHSL